MYNSTFQLLYNLEYISIIIQSRARQLGGGKGLM